MKKYLILLAAGVFALAACNKEEKTDGPLNATIEISPNPCNAGEPVTVNAKVSGGKKPYTFNWKATGNKQTAFEKTEQSFEWTFGVNGTYKIELTVTDADGSKAEKKKNIVVNPSKVDEKGELTLVWNGYMEGYNSVSSAAVDNSGNVYATTRSLKLYKFTSTGENAWTKAYIAKPSDGSYTLVSPTIDTDGTVFIGGGTTGPDGVFVAYNSDGTEKWRFKDFFVASGATGSPTVFAVMAGIGADNVYVGNTGITGSVLSINKTTGERVNYCKHGTGGPIGGARTGIAISKAGTLHWFGGVYGLFGAQKSLFDSKGDGVDFKWQVYGDGNAVDAATVVPYGALALVTINGKPNVCGIATDKQGTKVYAVDCADGTTTSVCYIEDTDSQDQGGVVVTKEGYLIASLNYTLGHANGGIIAINPANGEIVSRYSVQEKVSGAAAVDAAGNIHFGTEAGFYYIVKPVGDHFELLVKRNLAEIIKNDSRYASKYADMYAAKIWSSTVIGDDGKMYICYTDDDSRAFGGVACLSYEGCSGPADSEWPMMGRDRRHSNNQN